MQPIYARFETHSRSLSLSDAVMISAQNQKELERLLKTLGQDAVSILFHDGTERKIPRPIDNEQQMENYSGKKTYAQERGDHVGYLHDSFCFSYYFGKDA